MTGTPSEPIGSAFHGNVDSSNSRGLIEILGAADRLAADRVGTRLET
jgi:hypothetical protein